MNYHYYPEERCDEVQGPGGGVSGLVRSGVFPSGVSARDVAVGSSSMVCNPALVVLDLAVVAISSYPGGLVTAAGGLRTG